MKFPFEEYDHSTFELSKLGDSRGIRPEERPTEQLLRYGLVNVDKPSGPTSHMVAAYVKEILGIEKCGHSGTLDPGVTGVLPIALGNGSRIVQALLPAGKEYVGIMHLHKDVPEAKLRHAIAGFVGIIEQIPPVKSAVRRRKRKREVYFLDVLEIKERDVLFRVGCQAGTYIRKLCFDIGKALGIGAHMQELRRTRVANFTEQTAFSLQDLKDAFSYYKQGNDKALRKLIQPVEAAVSHLPKLWVPENAVESLAHGRSLAVPGVAKAEACIEAGRLVAVLSPSDELVALGEAKLGSEALRQAKRGIAVEVNKVFIGHAREA
jgi:H/ACA ribonucleoprotein complex subunit 4